MQTKPPELCTIRIMFPVVSDEHAINAKKKVTAALSDIENVQIHFSLMSTPQKGEQLNANAQ